MLAIATMAVGLLCATSSAHADFGFVEDSFTAATFKQDGSPDAQAGAHPYMGRSDFEFTLRAQDGYLEGYPRDMRFKLPPGFVGNPLATPKCPRATFALLNNDSVHFDPIPRCPPDSQVGIAYIAHSPGDFEHAGEWITPIYNVVPRDGVAAQLGMTVSFTSPVIDATVDTAGDYGLDVSLSKVSQALPVYGARVELWGVPNDPSHDAERFCGYSPNRFADDPMPPCPVDVPRTPFLTNPASCDAAQTSQMWVNTWEQPDVTHSASFTAPPITGCDRLKFNPSLDVGGVSSSADSPTGLKVALDLPQADDPVTGLAPPALRDATIALPEGMSVNPGSADGLAACSDAQLGLKTNAPIACPDGSKIGTVVARTPVLEEPLTGSVFIRSQASDDPESGEMFRLALVVESKERGLLVKLPGQVKANAETGRLETTFLDNPQVPVSSIEVSLKSGPRAPLATPRTCGTKTVEARLSSWGGQVSNVSDSFEIDCPTSNAFAPSFGAGSRLLVGGDFSPFVARIDRADRDQFLSGVTVDLPEGLIAKLRGVPLCDSAAADNGGCPAGSRVGTATVAAGPGSNPFHLSGDVYLTEGYRGAPYGLATHVLAKAGPFDLGWVRVRQALNVDPTTADISVVSDPLPQIVKGVPVRLRSVAVDVDRPSFTINPTDCSPKTVDATLTSIEGAIHKSSTRFQAAECQALGFRPKLALRLSGKSQRRTGGHPALRAVLTQGKGQANIGAVKVTLPKSIALDPRNANGLCSYEEGLKVDGGPVGCPASSVIGTATAYTPVLNRPLRGKVYFVEHKQRSKRGNLVSKLPSLLVALRGEVNIDLRARSSVDKDQRLVNTFPQVPDAPVSKFDLRLKGGDGGILAVTRTRTRKLDICSGRHTANVQTDGQNGKTADYPVAVKTPCANASKARAGRHKKSKTG